VNHNPPESDEVRAATRALARLSRVLERSSTELNLAHYRVLAAVAGGDERASRVASRLALGRPAISAAVDTLCERGLLTRGCVEGDQRAAALVLTPAGRDLLDRTEAEMGARLNDLCARTPDSAQVLRSLAWLGTALDAVVTERLAERAGAGHHVRHPA
jgi:DNA-binding MarR family transcriptional regulator